MSSHCSVQTGSVSQPERLLKSIRNHNFVNRVQYVLPKASISLPPTSSLLVKASLKAILSFLLEADASLIASTHLILLNRDVSHETSLCVAKSLLHLRLTAPLYQTSGLQGKLSVYSKGNKKLRQQLYDVTIDLSKGLRSLYESGDKNCARLFWLAEKQQEALEFALTSDKLEEVKDRLAMNADVAETTATAKHTDLGLCKVPSLTFKDDSDWVQSTLEWITYASIGGSQLFPHDRTDSYISSYSSLLEEETTEPLCKIEYDRALISPEFIAQSLDRFLDLEWFALVLYGVKDCNTSYSTGISHNFVSDGTNDAVVLVHKGQYVLWEISDSGDAH